MSGEQPHNPRFSELEIPEDELSYLDQVQKVETLLELLKSRGLYAETDLYCGIDGEPVQKNGSLGSRSQSWMVTEEQWRAAADAHDRFDDHHADPLHYAHISGELPALAVFDRKFFEPDPAGGRESLEWKLVGADSIDEATKAVIYFT